MAGQKCPLTREQGRTLKAYVTVADREGDSLCFLSAWPELGKVTLWPHGWIVSSAPFSPSSRTMCAAKAWPCTC